MGKTGKSGERSWGRGCLPTSRGIFQYSTSQRCCRSVKRASLLRASSPTLPELGLSIPFCPHDLFSDLSARGCPSPLSVTLSIAEAVWPDLWWPSEARAMNKGNPKPSCASEPKAGCPGSTPTSADTQPGSEARPPLGSGSEGSGPTLAQTPVGSWEEDGR